MLTERRHVDNVESVVGNIELLSPLFPPLLWELFLSPSTQRQRLAPKRCTLMLLLSALVNIFHVCCTYICSININIYSIQETVVSCLTVIFFDDGSVSDLSKTVFIEMSYLFGGVLPDSNRIEQGMYARCTLGRWI